MGIRVPDGDRAGAASARSAPVAVQAALVLLSGELTSPPGPEGVVVLADAAIPGGLEASDHQAAAALARAGFATLELDLLARDERAAEGRARLLQHDVPALAERLEGALAWLAAHPDLRQAPVGLFGADTGAAAALVVAARVPAVRAIVSRGGRPDLAHDVLREIRCPTLWIIGGADTELLDAHHRALRRIGANARLHVVSGAGRLLEGLGDGLGEGPGALDDALRASAAWFREHLARSMHEPGAWTGSTTDAKQGSSWRAR
jgi:putative phosphoribosyl transferase